MQKQNTQNNFVKDQSSTTCTNSFEDIINLHNQFRAEFA